MSLGIFWLASNSPRRREMFSWTGWSFRTTSSQVDESINEGEPALDYVKRLALMKASVVIPDAKPGDVIISADTTVVLDGKIIGKPLDPPDAYNILESLQNREHWVVTALAIRQAGHTEEILEVCQSRIQMRNYSDDEIEKYVASGDPLDKAGAYAIQNGTFHPVQDFNGCVASVMGLPLCHLERNLRKLPEYESIDVSAICQKNLKYKCPISRRVLSGENIG
jgi:septum formation protein